MKSKTTLLFLLLTFLMVNVPFSGFAYQSDLYGLYGNYTKSGDVITINRNGNNNLILSQVKAATFTYEVKVQVIEGDRMSLVYGCTDSGFYGVELLMENENEVSVKGFRDGDDGGLFFENISATVDKSQPIPFKIALTEAGELSVFVDGNQVHQMLIPNYKVGFLGATSYQSKVEMSDIAINIGDEKGERVDLKELSGNYSINTPTYTINRRGGGDNFVLSQTEYTALSIQGNVKILDGDRMSFVFGHKAGNNWHATELRIVDASRVALKAFKVGDNGGDLFNEEFNVNTTLPITYKINITEDGTLTVYLNGTEVKEARFSHYNGGRWGLLTWNTKASVSDLVVEVKDAGNNHVVGLSELNLLGGTDKAYSKTDISYIINKVDGGNNFIASTTATSDFSFEGNIEILEGDRMSFVFGKTKNSWFATELKLINSNRIAIKAFKEGDDNLFDQEFEIDATHAIPFKIKVRADGQLTTYLAGVEVQQATFPSYQAGSLGILTWNSKAKVSNLRVISHPQVAISSPSTIQMNTNVGIPLNQTIQLSGRNLIDDIVIMSDNELFTISPSTISPINGIVENVEVTITYNPIEEGTHTGTLAITSASALNLTITLNGTAPSIASSVDIHSLLFGSVVYSTNQRIFVRLNTGNDAIVHVYSATGQMINTMQLHKQSTDFNQLVESGVYLVQIISGGIVETQKVVVK